jgi:hypothetical protein
MIVYGDEDGGGSFDDDSDVPDAEDEEAVMLKTVLIPKTVWCYRQCPSFANDENIFFVTIFGVWCTTL